MNIKNRLIVFCAFCVLAGHGPAAAQAIDPRSPACQPTPEAIITLRPAYFGVPTIWDAVFGDKDGLMEFSSALPLENGNVLVAGEKLDSDFRPKETVLVELNNRARAVSDMRTPAKSGERSSGILPTSTGYIVASTILGGAKNNERHVRLSWTDKDRKFLREMILKDSQFNYESMALAPAVGGNGFLAVVHAINRRDDADQHGMVFRISDAGKLLWKRAYRPGIPNLVYGLSLTSDNDYIAGGYIKNEDGRMAGWLMKLNEDGTLIWQKTYPRGNYAVFRHGYAKAIPFASDHYVVTGQVMPHGTEPGAAWVMETDSNGEIVWQRYLRAGGYGLDGRAVRAYGDGRISVLANAKAEGDDGEGNDHIRLFTMSPRGGLMDDEAYMEGESARATQMVTGWSGERIVTAIIETSSKKSLEATKVELITEALIRQEKELQMSSHGESLPGPPKPTAEQAKAMMDSMPDEIRSKGWLFVATGLEPYTDPCVEIKADPAQ